MSTALTRADALEAEADALRAVALEAEVKKLCSEARRLDRAAIATDDLAELVGIINRVDAIAKRLKELRLQAERMAKRMMRRKAVSR
jgi:hypothetical protein